MRALRLFVSSLLLAAAVAVAARPAQAAPARLIISAPAVIVIDGWTGNVLYAKNPDAERYPASTVKIMTALVTLEHIPTWRWVTVSPLAASYGGSTANLFAGERLTAWNLLHGLLLPSGNDAAVALAEGVAGSYQRFVVMMNAEARRLHLWHTHYLTPNGLDTWGQVTTARDLANLARAAMQLRPFQRIVSARAWFVRAGNGAIVHQWYNLNHLLWSSPAVDGVKTGTTANAGACLVSSALQHGKWVIAVNLGSSPQTRFSDGLALLNYGLTLEGAPPSTR